MGRQIRRVPSGDTIRAGELDYTITQVSRHGIPLHVTCAHEAGRGSLREASLNLALAVYDLKWSLRETLPAWLRRVVPEPRRFWAHYVTRQQSGRPRKEQP